MLEANMFFMELAILIILLLIGFIRQRGMWFFFTLIFSALVMVDLNSNSFQLTYISGNVSSTVQMPSAIILMPIILMAVAFMAIAHLYNSSKIGGI